MYCSKCGKELPDQATFCTHCAAPVERATALTPAAGTPGQLDGSLRSIWNDFTATVKGWALTPFQAAMTAIAAVSAFFFLINVNGTLIAWLCAIAALFLVFLCARKVEIASQATATAFSILALGSLITGITNIIRYGRQYWTIGNGIETTLVHLVLYALVISVWLCAIQKTGNRRPVRLTSFVIACVLGAYEIVYVLLALRTSFKLALYGLAWVAFIAVYAVRIFVAAQNDLHNTQASSTAWTTSGVQAPPTLGVPQHRIYCTQCGAPIQSNPDSESIG